MKKTILYSKKFYMICVLAVIFILSIGLLVRFYRGKQQVEKEWQAQQLKVLKIKNWGATTTLEILPIIDWFTIDEGLKREAGVSYLIKTDKSRILFDVGMNMDQSQLSPLLYNMKQLGVSLDDADTIIISHNHPDHVGGQKWSRLKTFSLTNHQMPLGRKKVYTPIPMTYPGLTPIHSKDPMIISEGVATIGAIPNQCFFFGRTLEQALAVNVKGQGLILIVGCGHQTIPKLLQRTQALFDEPLYGLIGGLHYAVTDSRIVIGGIKIQRYVGTGREPWNPIALEDVQNDIKALVQQNLKVVRLSGHDSCDASMEAFRTVLTESYQEIKVGQKIVFGKK